MNTKKVNRLFLSLILLHFAVIGLMIRFQPAFLIQIVPNLILSELIIVLPAAFFLLVSRESLRETLGFHKIKLSTVFMIILFTYLAMPVTIVINAISLLVVDNTVAVMSGGFLQMPFWVILLLIGVYGPLCEECVFRGVIYRGYRRSGTALQAVLLSSLLFGLIHMNLNQAAYAVVIGLMLALLVEATGSLWGSVIFHVVFNSQQVCLMFLTERFTPGSLEVSAKAMSSQKELLIATIGFYIVIAAVSTALAGCVLVWIAKNQGRVPELRAIWRTRKKKNERMVTIPLIIAIVLALAYMSLELILP